MSAEAGRRLQSLVREAIGRSSSLDNISDFCRAANLNRNTVYAWFSGRAVPSPAALARAAAALEVPIADLYAAWEGRAAMPTTTEGLIALLIAQGAETNGHLSRLIAKLDGIGDRALAEELVQELRRQKPPASLAGGLGGSELHESRGRPNGRKPRLAVSEG